MTDQQPSKRRGKGKEKKQEDKEEETGSLEFDVLTCL